MAGLRVEIVKDFRKEEIYGEFEYNGVKIYIENNLNIKGDVYIFILLKIPFMKPLFDVKGIEIKQHC